jgi:hypothetical protein
VLTTLVLLGLAVVFATLATAWAGAVRSRSLRARFEALGKIPGRTEAEILRHVGKPHKRFKLVGGREVLEWRRINFRVALSFSGGVCEGIEYDTGDSADTQ